MGSAGCWHVRRAFCLLLALSAPAAAAPQPAQLAPASPPSSEAAAAAALAERARQLFDEGLKLAGEGHFELARAAFRGAYELRPHRSVLYNIAQCEVQLGDTAAAISTLTRFLASSGPELQTEQRRAVEQQLAELRALPSSVTEPEPGAAVLEPVVVALPPPAAPVSPQLRLRPFLLAGAGVALLGTAAGLYVWNDGRRDAWRAQRDELASTPAFSAQLARDPALWDRALASNQRLDAIQALDIVALVAAGAGLAALGAGAWDLFGSDEPPQLQVGLAPLLSWHGRW